MEPGNNVFETQLESRQTDGAEGFEDILESLRKDVTFMHALCDVVGSRYVFQTLPIPLPS
jgi:hypothetical protein